VLSLRHFSAPFFVFDTIGWIAYDSACPVVGTRQGAALKRGLLS